MEGSTGSGLSEAGDCGRHGVSPRTVYLGNKCLFDFSGVFKGGYFIEFSDKLVEFPLVNTTRIRHSISSTHYRYESRAGQPPVHNSGICLMRIRAQAPGFRLKAEGLTPHTRENARENAVGSE